MLLCKVINQIPNKPNVTLIARQFSFKFPWSLFNYLKCLSLEWDGGANFNLPLRGQGILMSFYEVKNTKNNKSFVLLTTGIKQ